MSGIPARVLCEIAAHEGLVLETYLDSAGVPTWAMGVTSASGHRVDRYWDQPATIERALEVSGWLLETRYLPAVVEAFDHDLEEHELAAALSFHWNTGQIGSAWWVNSVNAGDMDKARSEFMNWSTPEEIVPRREKERDLFFDAAWKGTTDILLYEVGADRRPTNPKPVDISAWSGSFEVSPFPLNSHQDVVDYVASLA